MGKKLDPTLAEQLMLESELKPIAPYPGSGKPWKCICLSCNRTVHPSLDSIRQGRGGCIECGKVKSGAKRRKVEGSEIKLQLLKYSITSSSELKLLDSEYDFNCKVCNNEFSFTLRHLIKMFPKPCPYCSGRRVSPQQANKVMQDADLLPLVPYPGNNNPWVSKCLKCGNTVSPRYAGIKSGRGGCGFCAGNKVDPIEALRVMNEIKLSPLVPFPGGEEPWLCLCLRCKNEVTPKFTNARISKLGCLWCAKQKVDPKQVFNAMLKVNLQPLDPYPGSSSKWKSLCLICGETVFPRWSVIQKGGNGCKNCKGRNISRAKRFSEDQVLPFMTSKNLKPLEPYPGTGKPWKCECLQCGKTVTPKHENLVQGQGGCKYCAESGLDYLAPACVYLITHPEWNAHKIGISGLHTKRLALHKSRGWSVYQVLAVRNGELAFTIEQEILKWVRKIKNLPPYLKGVDGWSETFDADAITLPEVWDQVRKVALIREKSS